MTLTFIWDFSSFQSIIILLFQREIPWRLANYLVKIINPILYKWINKWMEYSKINWNAVVYINTIYEFSMSQMWYSSSFGFRAFCFNKSNGKNNDIKQFWYIYTKEEWQSKRCDNHHIQDASTNENQQYLLATLIFDYNISIQILCFRCDQIKTIFRNFRILPIRIKKKIWMKAF